MKTKFAVKNKDGKIVVEFDRPQPYGETKFNLSDHICNLITAGERRFMELAKANEKSKKGRPSQRAKQLFLREGIYVEFCGFIEGAKVALEHMTDDDELTVAALFAKWQGLLATVFQARCLLESEY